MPSGWAGPCPFGPTKQQTDACFERMAEHVRGGDAASGRRRGREAGRRLAQRPLHRPHPGTAAKARPARNRPSKCRCSMAWPTSSRPRSFGAGCGCASTCPIGEMMPGMAYLVRRLLENTSNQSWLRAGFFDHATDEELLASPHTVGSAHHADFAGRSQPCPSAIGSARPSKGWATGGRLSTSRCGDFSQTGAAGPVCRGHAPGPRARQ